MRTTKKKPRPAGRRKSERTKAKPRAKAPGGTRSKGNSKITPFLMFNANPEEAARFYTGIFPNSRIVSANPMQATFILDGQRFQSYNGGDYFKFSEGVSFFVSCKNQKEVDYYWERLTADGGAESQCGWLKDKYGLSWQIIPTILLKLFFHPDKAKAERAKQAMFEMQKIDIAALKAAAR